MTAWGLLGGILGMAAIILVSAVLSNLGLLIWVRVTIMLAERRRQSSSSKRNIDTSL
jgi:uncharacterized membrane protein